MILKNIKDKKNRGFTIVELLVVIVVIGILAAITIVSYTGITAKANASATKQMASNVISKAAIYQTEGSTFNWPITGALAMSTTNSSAAITGVTVSASAAIAAASMTQISYQVCGTTNSTTVTTAPADLAALTGASGVITGIKVGYWDYSLSTPAPAYLSAGQTTGTGYTVNGVTYANIVACFFTAS